MTPAEVIRNLSLKGYRLWVEGDRLKIQAPEDAKVPPEIVSRLQAIRDEVFELLDRQARAIEGFKRWDGASTERRTVCIECPWGRVWLVPDRTGAANRIEASWAELHEDPAGTLARCQTLGNAALLFEGKVLANGPPLPAIEPLPPNTRRP